MKPALKILQQTFGDKLKDSGFVSKLLKSFPNDDIQSRLKLLWYVYIRGEIFFQIAKSKTAGDEKDKISDSKQAIFTDFKTMTVDKFDLLSQTNFMIGNGGPKIQDDFDKNLQDVFKSKIWLHQSPRVDNKEYSSCIDAFGSLLTLAHRMTGENKIGHCFYLDSFLFKQSPSSPNYSILALDCKNERSARAFLSGAQGLKTNDSIELRTLEIHSHYCSSDNNEESGNQKFPL